MEKTEHTERSSEIKLNSFSCSLKSFGFAISRKLVIEALSILEIQYTSTWIWAGFNSHRIRHASDQYHWTTCGVWIWAMRLGLNLCIINQNILLLSVQIPHLHRKLLNYKFSTLYIYSGWFTVILAKQPGLILLRFLNHRIQVQGYSEFLFKTIL